MAASRAEWPEVPTMRSIVGMAMEGAMTMWGWAETRARCKVKKVFLVLFLQKKNRFLAWRMLSRYRQGP
jgi:hypothetical protein